MCCSPQRRSLSDYTQGLLITYYSVTKYISARESGAEALTVNMCGLGKKKSPFKKKGGKRDKNTTVISRPRHLILRQLDGKKKRVASI